MSTKRLAIFAAVFLFSCACATFCSLAGGVQWGTPVAGFIAYVAVMAGFVAGLIVAEELG